MRLFGWHKIPFNEDFLDMMLVAYGFFLFGMVLSKKVYIIHDDSYKLYSVEILGHTVWEKES
jgi:hypothetical protein